MKRERDLRDELATHQAMAARDGASAREFGNPLLVAESTRDQWPLRWLVDLGRDLRYAVRMLAKAPGFTAVALLTLALGIGANTAMFTLINAALLRVLPVGHPRQLVMLTDPTDIGSGYGIADGSRGLLTYAEYRALRDQNQAFTGLMASEAETANRQADWSLPGQPRGNEPISFKLVSDNYFSVLEIPAYRGRVFDPHQPLVEGGEPWAVISYNYWTHRFARDPSVISRSFRLNRRDFTVIGITPPGFFGENVGTSPEVYLPLAMSNQALPGVDRLHDPASPERLMWLQSMGRLKPGVTLAQAQAASNVVFLQSVEHQAGAVAGAAMRRDVLTQHLVLTPGGRGTSGLRHQFGDPLWVLFGLVGLVLLLAIVNLASLLLARATARQKEMGVRLALGAGRRRIIRQLLVESVLLSVLGGLLGLALALWSDNLLLQLVSASGDTVTLSLAPDLRVLGFVAVVCILTGILFGLAPALHMSRTDLNATLQAQGRGGSERTKHVFAGLIRGGLPLGKLLIIGQVALSVVLLAGAGLFVHSLEKLSLVPLGFQPEHLTEFSVNPGAAGFKGQADATFFHRALDRVAASPGVRAAALTDNGIFTGGDCSIPASVEGFKPPNANSEFDIRCDSVTADYFQAAGIPLLAGRSLNSSDYSGAVHVLINQAFADRVFTHRNPIGRQVHDLEPEDKGATYTIVGVVADSKHNSPADKPAPRIYLPFFNSPAGDPITASFVLVRSSGEFSAGTVAIALHAVAPNLPPPHFTSMHERVDQALAPEDLLAKLSAAFGVLALLIAAIGLYGVMSYGVARRTPEIGVRMALGAGRGAVTGMVLGETLLLAAFGIAMGIPAALGGAKLLTSQMPLFGLQYYDPVALTAAVAILAGAAVLAGFVPAYRAAHVDPLTALREE